MSDNLVANSSDVDFPIVRRYVKSLFIKGFKKFEKLHVDFHDRINILVGENEAGKSTILEALKIVFQQTCRNSEKNILFDLFNLAQRQHFEAEPSIATLPSIHIEVMLELEDKGKDSQLFLGENHDPAFGQGALYGVKFDCSFIEEEAAGLGGEIAAGRIPVDYYKWEWRTFADLPCSLLHPPLVFLPIDTSVQDVGGPFSRYARTLFLSCFAETPQRWKHKHDFRNGLKDVVETLGLPVLSDTQKFGINDKRLVLENLMAIFDGDIPLENKGRGKESIIKMELAFARKGRTNIHVATIEEPENHLSYSNMRKMLDGILQKNMDTQLIIATHSNMIASRLDLRNVLWISEGQSGVGCLEKVDSGTACFFSKLDHSNLLDLLLAEKVILVEGATEFLLMPKIYKEIVGHSIEEDNITVLSCNGIAYKRYFAIAETRENRVVAITDNDGNPERINEARAYNDGHRFTHVFMDGNPEQWTWEKCLFNLNKDYFESILEVKSGAKYLYRGNDFGQHLGYMLNNKADLAYRLVKDNPPLAIPPYIKDAFQWLNS